MSRRIVCCLLLSALAAASGGCSEEREARGTGGQCVCDDGCPEGRCDLEVTLDAACPRGVTVVVDGEEVGQLEPGGSYRSCSTTWSVGETLTIGVPAGTTPYFRTETLRCEEDVDHIRPTWRCGS